MVRHLIALALTSCIVGARDIPVEDNPDPAQETPAPTDPVDPPSPDVDDPTDPADPADPTDPTEPTDPEPVDCAPLAAMPEWEVCGSTDERCDVVFRDGTGCDAVCTAAGLQCGGVYEDLDGECAPDTSRPALGCGATGHQSDFCVCVASTCMPDCGGRECGDDGCGGSCGDCGSGTCDAVGQCQCGTTCEESLLQCGQGYDDGCGGTLDCAFTCPQGLPCTADGLCGWDWGTCAGSRCVAFPGAEGEGRYARGGRGGAVAHVTSLANDGPGTLRRVLATGSGPLTVVFDVAGIITLTEPLDIDRDELTLAGQTAPGDGIIIRGYQTTIRSNHVIVQHLRFRAGDIYKATQNQSGFTEDSLTLWGEDIMVDHVSASWGIDENLSGGTQWDNVTVQWSIIAEGLHTTELFHGEYRPDHEGHSMGSLFKIRDQDHADLTLHHNLYANNNNRNPSIGTYTSDQTLRADIRNNVIHNCPNSGYTSGNSEWIELNYVGNYQFRGRSGGLTMFEPQDENNVRMHKRDNLLDLTNDGQRNGADLGFLMWLGSGYDAVPEIPMEPVTTHPVHQAIDLVLDTAGARPWSRDDTDRRNVDDVRNGTGRLIDSQDEVGGWGTLDVGVPIPDTDRDGMADDWERRYGSNPNQADNNGDLDGDGYTNLEAYLHWAGRLR